MRYLALAVALLSGCSSSSTQPDGSVPGQDVTFTRGVMLGATHADAFCSMAATSGGALYLGGASKELVDRFTADLVVARVGADGSLAWAKTWGGSKEDSQTPHVDSEGEASARVVAVTSDGAVLLTGRSKSAGNGLYAAVLLKLGADGNLAWARAWRPHWDDRVNGAALGNAVAVLGDTAWVVGSTGGGTTNEEGLALLLAFDVATGALRYAGALDPSPGFNDRLFSVVPGREANTLFVSGWQGQTNEGLLLELDVSSVAAPTVAWAARVTLPLGSTVPDLDVDADGNVYAALDVHGVDTSLQVLKLSSAGVLSWVRGYNTGSGRSASNTHVVRALGGQVLLGGRVSFPDDDRETDTRYGDALWLELDASGALTRDVYFFTGKSDADSTIDRVRGFADVGGARVVMGNSFARGTKYSGTWRTPKSRGITPTFGPVADVALQRFTPGAFVDLSASAPKTEADLAATMTLTDVTSSFSATTPAAADGTPRSTQGFVFWF